MPLPLELPLPAGSPRERRYSEGLMRPEPEGCEGNRGGMKGSDFPFMTGDLLGCVETPGSSCVPEGASRSRPADRILP